MPDERLRRLMRLKRLTEVLYRLECAKTAELKQVQVELADTAAAAISLLDDEHESRTAFLQELTIARASRLRRRLLAAEGTLTSQLAIAVEQLAGFRGMEARLCELEQCADQQRAARVLDEVIDICLERQRASLEQASSYNKLVD